MDGGTEMTQLKTGDPCPCCGQPIKSRDPDVLFIQVHELANKLRGLLLKARGRADKTTAQVMEKKLQSLADDLWMVG